MHLLQEQYFTKVDKSDSHLYFGLIIFVTIAAIQQPDGLESTETRKGLPRIRKMRRGISSAPDKVILAGVGGSPLDSNIILTTLSDRSNPGQSNATFIQIITTPPPCNVTQTSNVCLSEPQINNIYTTPQQAAANGAGQRPALGRPPVIIYTARLSMFGLLQLATNTTKCQLARLAELVVRAANVSCLARAFPRLNLARWLTNYRQLSYPSGLVKCFVDCKEANDEFKLVQR